MAREGLIVLLAVVLACFITIADTQNAQRVEFTLVFTVQVIDGMNQGPASSVSISTDVSSSGLPTWSTSQLNTNSAYYSSISQFNSTLAYEEYGNITFSEGNSIQFTSNGFGGQLYGVGSPKTLGTSFGSIRYEITGGTGLFSGAIGAMTDVFTNQDNVIQINVWGICWVPTSTFEENQL